ncbi:MAG: hypothetical protein ACYC9J_01575 [Sulfuricaulis sp.]
MQTFNKTILAGAALLATAVPVWPASPGALSWFNDTPFAGVGAVGVPDVRLRNPDEVSSFDVNLYRSQQIASEEGYVPETRGAAVGADALRLYGSLVSSGSQTLNSSYDDSSSNQIGVFGVNWQHNVDLRNSFAVSAEYGAGTSIASSPLNTLDTRAAFSWTSHLPSGVNPSVTGSVFLGDETGGEDIYRHLGRRYYGFTVGGSLTLFQTHTPYVSFKMQKSFSDSQDEQLLLSPRSGDQSYLSAGWKWQVQRDFSLQAEASYGLGSTPGLDATNLERSRVLFGSQFDFK